jgi:hypothetical protein
MNRPVYSNDFFRNFDVLNKEGDLLVPEGVRVAQPYINSDEIKNAARTYLDESYEESNPNFLRDYKDFMVSGKINGKKPLFIGIPQNNKQNSQLEDEINRHVKDIKMKALNTISRSYYCGSGNEFNFKWAEIILSEFQIGEPIIDYRPFRVSVCSEKFKASDLFSGHSYECSKSPYDELDGLSSQISHFKGDVVSKNVFLGITSGKYDDRIGHSRRVVRPVIGNGEPNWYIPIWEVPVAEKTKNKIEQRYVFKYGMFRVGEDWWMLDIPFEVKGAAFFDSFGGNLIYSVANDCNFVDEFGRIDGYTSKRVAKMTFPRKRYLRQVFPDEAEREERFKKFRSMKRLGKNPWLETLY